MDSILKLDVFGTSNEASIYQNSLETIKKNLKKKSPTSIIAMEIIRKSHCNFVPVKVKLG